MGRKIHAATSLAYKNPCTAPHLYNQTLRIYRADGNYYWIKQCSVCQSECKGPQLSRSDLKLIRSSDIRRFVRKKKKV
jgi:hypothetical protein